jgi:hypothetical protein
MQGAQLPESGFSSGRLCSESPDQTIHERKDQFRAIPRDERDAKETSRISRLILRRMSE